MNTKLKGAATFAALVFALLACLERPAYAYVDPGSALLTVQTIGAMFFGFLLYIRRRITSLLKGKTAKSPKDVDRNAVADPPR